jgi:hypothetical protein
MALIMLPQKPAFPTPRSICEVSPDFPVIPSISTARTDLFLASTSIRLAFAWHSLHLPAVPANFTLAAAKTGFSGTRYRFPIPFVTDPSLSVSD